MKEYIRKIVNLFINSKHNNSIESDVYRWLMEPQNREEKDSALRDVWNSTSAEMDSTMLLSFGNLYGKIDEKSRQRHFNIKSLIAIAAVLMLGVINVGVYIAVQPSDYKVAMVNNYTKTGEINTIILPDGSRVKTNAETLLVYPKEFDKDNRTVFMVGEAYFDVAKDPSKPFVVNSTNLSITALGTVFNVSAHLDNEDITTTLLSGKIEVTCSTTGQTHIITPRQQVIYNKDTGNSRLLTDVNIDDVTAWQKGLIIFKNESFATIVSELEKQYDITFQYNTKGALNRDRYNFKFNKDATLDYIMNIMQQVIGEFNYKIVDDVCYIKSTKHL